MSRRKRNHQASTTATNAWRRARQAAAQVRPAAAQVKPHAKSTGAAARRRVHRTRAWAAPRVERTGQILQDSVAPKVSALLSSAARRLEPPKPRHPRWRKLAGISLITASAVAAAAAVLVRNRGKPDVTTSAADANADDVAPAAEMSDRQEMASTGADADVNGQVRTT
jgi:hypothetical protein